jgi:acetyl-CoA carboxylase biotin carboxyl carrier protein
MTSLPFDADAVRSLAIILADTGLTEIEIEGKEGRIRVARAPAQIAAAPAATVHVAPQPAAPAHAPAPTPAPVDDAQHPGAVVSPMVGIAYLAPEPGAAPFVVPGQAVAAGQTLLLIEAMKTFNQIKAPKAGTVTRILVTPGAPVEYGQPLLILE